MKKSQIIRATAQALNIDRRKKLTDKNKPLHPEPTPKTNNIEHQNNIQ